MNQLLFSQAALYQLQQLVKAVRAKTGVRHRLSQQKDVFSLLRYSCTSPDTNIADHYSMFINELDENQKDYLQSKGLLLSRTNQFNSSDTKTIERRAAI